MRILIRTVGCLLLTCFSVIYAPRAQGSPENKGNPCIHYATVQRPDALRKLCVNAEAIQAVQRGQALPVGTTIRMVVYNPTGQHLLGRTSLRSKANDGWHYTEMVGVTTTHDSPACIACHSAVKDQDYMFTLPQLLAYAKTGQVQVVVCNRLGRRPCGAQGK